MDALLRLKASVSGQNDIKRLGNSMQGVQGKVKNLQGSVGRLGGAFKALFAAAAVGGFVRVLKGAIDTADSFQKLEVRTGVAAEKLMAYVEAGKLADVSQKQLEVGLKTLARTQVEAADGVKTYADTYAKLGIDVKKVNGDLKPTDQLLGEIADRFADLPDGPEKAAAALDLFGKSGVDMITMLNGGSAALEEFNFGLSGEFAQNAAFYNDEVTKLSRVFNKFGLQLLDALLPALTQITQSFATLFDEGTNLEPLFTVIAGSIRVVAAAVFATIKLVDVLIKNITAGVQIVGRVLAGDFSGAIDLAKNRFTGFVDQAKEDFAELVNIFTGTATAPEGYTRKTSGGRLDPLQDQSSKQQNASLKEREKLLTNILDISLKETGNFINILNGLRDEKRLLEAKLAGKEKEIALDMQIEKITDGMPAKFAAVIEQRIRGNADIAEQIENQNEALRLQNEETAALNEKFKSIGDTIKSSVGGALEGLIFGTKSLGASLADMAKSLAKMFLQMGVQAGFSALGSGGGFLGKLFGSANGNVFAQSKIVPFAYGGVVNKPTIFPMANGMGLMGEAGPEAIMPLRRGPNGKLGVESSGGGVGNVVVNVDASGSKVQGDGQQSKQLGQLIGAAVQAEIVKQKMPGGLLN